MDAPQHWIGDPIRRLIGVAIALACAVTASAVVPASALATGSNAVSAVDSAGAVPDRFVPDWDGHTDMTVVTYHLLRRSDVTLRVLDSRARTVASLHLGALDAGTQQATWDGRDSRGAVLPAGTYRVRVDAIPTSATAAPDAPGDASMGGATIVGGARSVAVVLQRPAVTLTSVQLTRTAIGRVRATGATSARFRLSAPASVSAAVVDAAGSVVATLATGRRRAGSSAVTWNGRTASGAPAPDGEYQLLVSATGGGRPTATMELPVRVDRVAPTLGGRATTTATVRGTAVQIPLQVVASEAGTVVVRYGRRSVSRTIDAGTRTISVDGHELGLVAIARPRSIRVRVELRDGAGNAVSRTTRVAVPERTRQTTPPPPAGGGTASPTPPAGKWPWPVAGIVTSEFGLRDGRPHEGLDIGAPTGSSIHPTTTGTVAFVGVYGGYGNLVIVDHGSGITTRYAHMSRFGSFAVGARVDHTDVIGYVGCTGHCTGPHLHFETRVNDVARNPRAWLAPS